MFFSRNVLIFFFVLSSLSLSYLYSYPAVKGCRFHGPDRPGPSRPSSARKFYNWFTGHGRLEAKAPFRLLAFGDPQLEGDTSIAYDVNDSYRPSKLRINLANAPTYRLKLEAVLRAVSDLTKHGIWIQFQAWRKRLDLLGNDYYLAHVYRTIHKYTDPTHVTVLGDLLGSQWIDDAEFDRRASRYWKRVFADSRRIDDSITGDPTIEVLGEDKSWSKRIINIAGNHDIGYAGDLTPERLARFERAFGAANWEIVFEVPLISSITSASGEGRASEPSFLRLVMLNSMNLDTPAKNTELQGKTYEYINEVISRSEPVEHRSVATILLTHIPLYKEEGVCVDGPFFSFHSEGLKEQNHLSYDASRSIFEGIFGFSGNIDAPGKGLGRNGLVINGHDHEGCDVFHYLPPAREGEGSESRRWNATRWSQASHAVNATAHGQIPGIREVTLRSMMGEYGGWAYLISAWVEGDKGEWRFEVKRCSAGVQHWWWAIHALALVTIVVGVIALVPAGTGTKVVSTNAPERARGSAMLEQKRVRIEIPPQRPRSGTFGLGNTDDLSWDPPDDSPVVRGTGANLMGNGHVTKRRT